MLEFVDTHVHFYDFKQKHRGLRWVWLEPDFVHPVVGNIDGIKAERFTAHEYVAESRMSGVTKAVHVQAALGTEDPVQETIWLQAMADETGWPHAIVGDARLQQAGVEQVLERHAQHPNVRGIRDFGEGDYLVDPDFHRGYALLEKYDFVCDLDCVWENMAKARALAEKFPNIVMILDHAGFPQARDDEYFQNWRRALRDLAGAPNCVMKISGLGMCDQRWTTDSIRPWVLECIEAFGVQRSFFATNWPLDRLYSSFTDVINAYTEVIADFSHDEQTALFSRNAERYYRI